LHSESGTDFKEKLCVPSILLFVETYKINEVQDIFMCFTLEFSFVKASTSLNFIGVYLILCKPFIQLLISKI
jgi:hypothetical protein